MATFSKPDIRQAIASDADGMSAVLAPILQGWNSARPFDPAHVLAHYVEHTDRVSCVVGIDNAGTVLGFQSLKVARSGNIYDLPEGWGIIGTYVAKAAAGHGVGRLMFDAILKHAKAYGLQDIDATIGADNSGGRAYYGALGFQPYRDLPGAVGARFPV
ncbi:N-acetyltransferase family protein [Tateyamaria sp.]|uniref:GNAT family N-acetyltransferase n=1 Tax=Tateyamaria sp. TaxID=1929288 RepID=UPI003B20BADA